MAKRFSMETVDRAEQLYCGGGHTLREVEALTGVSFRTLERWNNKYGWAEKRIEARRTIQGIRIKTVRLREKFIENRMQTLSARDVLSVASMESVVRKAALDDAKRQPDPALDLMFRVSGEEESVAALRCGLKIQFDTAREPTRCQKGAIRGPQRGQKSAVESALHHGPRPG